MKHLYFYLPVAFIVLPALNSSAETIFYQDATVEVANRTPTSLDRTGSAVTVIEEEKIHQRQAPLTTIIEETPGAYVWSNGGTGQLTQISLRGLPARYVKTLYNGIDISDPAAPQNYYNFAYMPASPLSRIELVRGNQSTLYGSDAIAGVLNMQSFFDQKTKGSFATFGAMAGSYDTVNIYARGGYNGKNGGVSFYGDFSRTRGISAADKNKGSHEADGSYSGSAGLNGWYDINNEFTLEAGGQFLRGYSEFDGATAPTFVLGDTDYNTSIKQYMGYTRLKGQNLMDDRLQFNLDLSAMRTFRSYNQSQKSWYDGRRYMATLKGDYLVFDWLNLSLGGEYSYSQARYKDSWSTKSSTHSINEKALWALASLKPLDNLDITLGARLQNHSVFGNKVTWRSTANYLLETTGTRFHGSAASGFRAPSLYELYAPSLGNEKLNPESSQTYDFGIEQKLWDDRLVVDVTGFYTNIKNKIDYENGHYVHSGRQRSEGVEVSLSSKPIQWLELSANYAYVKSWDTNKNHDAFYQPRHRLTTSATWIPNDKFKFGVDIRSYSNHLSYASGYPNGKRLPGYALVDLRGEYALNDQILFKANIRNLFDKNYSIIDDYGTQGFSVYAGLEVNF